MCLHTRHAPFGACFLKKEKKSDFFAYFSLIFLRS
nr:MAG TPA: PufQ cytochrome subunit [Caudoviricetes sp.]